MYQALNTIKIDTNAKTVAMIANEIKLLQYRQILICRNKKRSEGWQNKSLSPLTLYYSVLTIF